MAWRQSTNGGKPEYSDPTLAAVYRNILPQPEEYEGVPLPTTDRVYFIWAIEAHAIKVGTSKNVSKRLHNIQQNHPHELRLIGHISGGQTLEQLLHEKFEDKRLRGEWFRDSILPEVLRLITEDSTATLTLAA
jgi:hypothetical protein